jgi:hypothetical protein
LDKYLKVENFLSKETCEVLAGAFLLLENVASSPDRLKGDKIVPESFSRYGYSAADSLLYYLRPKIERLTGFDLLPTFSYFRIYRNGHRLPMHTDRHSCEVSATITLKKDDTPWSIILDGEDVFLKQGDAAIYMGMEVLHSRKPFEGEECVQLFVHYVKADGQHTDWIYDKRRIGIDTYNPF